MCVIRLRLWSTCQRSCMMLRKCLMPNSSGKLSFLKTQTHKHTRQCLILVLIQGHWQRGYTRAFSLAQVFLLAVFSDPYPSVTHTFHQVELSLLYQVIKISSNWHIHKDTHSNTLCTLSMCPWVNWQFGPNHQTKHIWTSSLRLFFNRLRSKTTWNGLFNLSLTQNQAYNILFCPGNDLTVYIHQLGSE